MNTDTRKSIPRAEVDAMIAEAVAAARCSSPACVVKRERAAAAEAARKRFDRWSSATPAERAALLAAWSMAEAVDVFKSLAPAEIVAALRDLTGDARRRAAAIVGELRDDVRGYVAFMLAEPASWVRIRERDDRGAGLAMRAAELEARLATDLVLGWRVSEGFVIVIPASEDEARQLELDAWRSADERGPLPVIP